MNKTRKVLVGGILTIAGFMGVAYLLNKSTDNEIQNLKNLESKVDNNDLFPVVEVNKTEERKETAKLIKHNLFYLSPESEDKEIIVKVGDGIILQTDSYPLVPAYLNGEMTIKIDGEWGVLDAISNDSKKPTIFFTPFELEKNGKPVFKNYGKLQRNILIYAFKSNVSNKSTDLTVRFFDNERNEMEKTKYKVIMK